MSNTNFFSRTKQLLCRSAILLGVAFTLSCSTPADPAEASPTVETAPVVEAPTVIIQSETFTDKSEGLIIESSGEEATDVLTSADESWLSFAVDIPEPGRYSVELRASAAAEGSTAWIEDYIDNKDGRTYNITGNIPIQAHGDGTIFHLHQKDGSPLNKGVHQMKLHLKGEGVRVDWFKFTLLKKHQLTPQKMTQNMSGEELHLVWSDEFDGTGMPDTSKWTFDIGDWGWGNNELQYYTENRLENARQEGGNLIIEARKNDIGQEWTSARLTTRGKVSFVYGKIEFRAKVPTQRGNWSAGWTLGDDYVDELSWPYCGEIDIMESVGYEIDDATGDGKAHASIHCGAYYFKLGNQPTADLAVKDMDDSYHTYAVDWSPEGITGLVDDQVYFTYKDTSNALAWPFDKAQNIILNLAMGGGWGGLKGMDESMTSQVLSIDYVRVYERR